MTVSPVPACPAAREAAPLLLRRQPAAAQKQIEAASSQEYSFVIPLPKSRAHSPDVYQAELGN
jgi:hypothetical protein